MKNIRIEPEILTDGSVVYNIEWRVEDERTVIVIECYSEKGAQTIINMLKLHASSVSVNQ